MNDLDTALARAFQAIEHPQERLRNLTKLIESLSPWERRHVRTQLGDFDGLASLEDLPADIVCVILSHLHIEDVLACAAASKRCRATWTDSAVVVSLFRRFFPVHKAPVTFSAFRKACRKLLRRRAGKFTHRFDLTLPNRINMQKWECKSRKTFRPDPVLHPNGKYPKPWLDSMSCGLACFGGGNVVWYAAPDFFVVDNMYTQTRKVIRVLGGMDRYPAEGLAAASKSVVALQPYTDYTRLLVYNLETNTSATFQLPSSVLRIVVRERRIYLVMSGRKICVLEHDGSRLLTKFHFNIDKGLDNICPDFRPHVDSGEVLVFPHPYLPDRIFTTIMGYMDTRPLSGGVASTMKPDPTKLDSFSDAEPKGLHHRSTLIVREFHGDSPVAIYRHDIHKLHPDGLVLQRPGTRAYSPGSKVVDMRQKFHYASDVKAIDGQGSFWTGSWSVAGPAASGPGAAGLSSAPDNKFVSIYQTSFNVITKTFDVQRYLDPRTDLDISDYAPSWEQQKLIPWLPGPGVLRHQLLDAHEAGFVPTRLPRPDTREESEDGWALKLRDLDDMWEWHDQYHDEDFTLLCMIEYDQLYVWSFVEDEEREGDDENETETGGEDEG